MKTIKSLLTLPAILLILVLSLVSCKDSTIEFRKYTANVPVYMSYEDLRIPAKALPASSIQKAGKIYIQGNYLFINEKYKGIHVFDNSNPALPINLAFIEIPGNVDLAVKGKYLYADNYVDLIVLDITTITSPLEVARVKNIFPYTIPEATEQYPIASIDQKKGVIVGWEVKEVTEKIDNVLEPYYYLDKFSGNFLMSDSRTGANTVSVVGVGGSMARFIITGDLFYCLNQTNMQVFNIAQPNAPVVGAKIEMSRMVETVFIDGKYLFVGTQTSMLIYDISDPARPLFKSEFNHFKSCDPVVVQDGYAYVTLRSGNRCGNWQNVLQVIDIRVISNPVLVKSYAMTEPYGLGVDKKTLFVCDGQAGLKIFNATDPLRIDQNILKQYSNLKAIDVIPLDPILIMIAQDGLYQYSYADLKNIQQLSKIPIGKQ